MSIVVRFPPSNTTKQQYDTVRNTLEQAGEWPADGVQVHVCFGDPQDIRVSEIWESREKFEAFGEKLRPRLEEAGIQIAGEPEVFEVLALDRT
jgi:sugar phosphate isomerase/epimerase